MPVYQSSNSAPVDRPFAKLLHRSGGLDSIRGIPPVSSSDWPYANLASYDRAASILGLDSSDRHYVAARVRHLAYILRSSRFAGRISWRSCLNQLDDLVPMFNSSSGLVDEAGKVGSLTVSLLTSGEQDPQRLSWNVRIAGTMPSLQLFIDGAAAGGFSTSLPATPLQGSGRSIVASCSAANGTAISYSARVAGTYSGNFAPILERIKSSREFFFSLKPDQAYIDAVISGDVAEDAVAAFILAVDAL